MLRAVLRLVGERARCDRIACVRQVRAQRDIPASLEDDLRVDLDAAVRMRVPAVREVATRYRRQSVNAQRAMPVQSRQAPPTAVARPVQSVSVRGFHQQPPKALKIRHLYRRTMQLLEALHVAADGHQARR